MATSTSTQQSDNSTFTELTHLLTTPGVEATTAEAIALQLLTPSEKDVIGSTLTRSELHISLTADTHTNLSSLFDQIALVEPFNTHVNGGTTSYRGAIGSISESEFETGALTAENSHTAIEHPEIFPEKVQRALQQILDSGTCTINKACFHQKLSISGVYLLASNPEHSVFDEFDDISDQLTIPERLHHATSIHLINKANQASPQESSLSIEAAQQYITDARSLHPVPSPQIHKELNDYVDSLPEEILESFVTPGGARLKQNLLRFTHAYARSRLSESMTTEDAQRAISFMSRSLNKIWSGQTDKGMFSTVTADPEPRSVRDRQTCLKDVIVKLSESNAIGAPEEEIYDRLTSGPFSTKDVDHLLQRLEDSGDIYKIDSGHYRVL